MSIIYRTVQNRYDDAESLSLKYALAAEMGLRGVGPFEFTDLQYSTQQEAAQAAGMWKAIGDYRKKGGAAAVGPTAAGPAAVSAAAAAARQGVVKALELDQELIKID